MPSPTILLALLLALSLAGNALLSKLYVGAKQDVARVQQAYDSFTAQVKVLGEEAAKKAAVQEMSDKLRKDTADAEHKAAVARLTTDISKLRSERDARSRSHELPPAPAGSKCPDGQACFDYASLESTLRGFIKESRGWADQCAEIEAEINTARKWAQGQH